MKKCDKCERKALFNVSGYYAAHYLCAPCAANLCESVGDTAGAEKFRVLA